MPPILIVDPSFPGVYRTPTTTPSPNPKEFAIRPIVLALALCFVTVLPAQSPSTSPASQPQLDLASHPDRPQANPAEVDTIVHTVHAFFSTLSVPAGGKLDRNRLNSLFVPNGRIAYSIEPSSHHPADVLFMTPEQYADNSDAQSTTGFYDRNPANEIEQFGLMAHVYATYESRLNPNDPKPIARGIKSIELLHSNNRWYILQVYWDSERPGNPLPESYLHDSTH